MIINGDALTVLKRMDDESVHCAITSSPYYGLRQYNTNPQIWDGDPNCQHEWKNNICNRCSAWRGELGSETTPELFVRHITTICHELKRVLRSDGIFFYNIGDSFASGKGTCFNPGGGENSLQKNCKESGGIPLSRGNKSALAESGLKPKDLIGIPWDVAFALRADGWYLRADLPWVKHNSMPSSVTDRPCSSIEHIFLFSKSGDTKFWTHPTKCGTRNQPEPDYVYTNKATGEVTQTPPQDWKEIMYVKEGETKESNLWKRRNLWDGHDYFYDHVATLQPATTNENRPPGVKRSREYNGKINIHPDSPQQFRKQDGTGNPTVTGFNDRYEDNGTGLRFMRDSDFFLKTWQGLIQNEDGEPLALVINTKGYKGGHFAPFPIRLIEPLILAGTSSHGVCPHCGAPWARQTEKGKFIQQSWGEHPKIQELHGELGATSCFKSGGTQEIITTGWLPSCNCENNVPVPAIVLDPFSGSSATGVACKLHNRNYIGIELNPEYCKMGEQRVRDGK